MNSPADISSLCGDRRRRYAIANLGERSHMEQIVRFVTTADGVKLAYATSGTGRALLKSANWLNHVEYDWQSPVWRHWFEFLSDNHRLIRYDARGCGLSDWKADKLAFEWQVRDLECIIEAAQLSRFALLCLSQGAAAGIEIAARYPHRVSHLVILGGYALGWAKRGDVSVRHGRAMMELIRFGWGQETSTFRKLFAELFIPDASAEQIGWYGELMRLTTQPEVAARILEAFGDIDVRSRLREVRTPTLILHARGDRRVPFDEGRALAAGIPHAQFVALESNNHILTANEPAWQRFQHAVSEFLGSELEQPRSMGTTPAPAFADLTARERAVVQRLALGESNSQIATRLSISEKTVRNHLTTIFGKLGVTSRAQAIVLVRDHGLLDMRH
jgi:pimeloyl-ACP methyl ester carboxylesterase/DNA-binding CsgD family transcriptional regulator